MDVETLEHRERLAAVLIRTPMLEVHVRVEVFIVFTLRGELLVAVCRCVSEEVGV